MPSFDEKRQYLELHLTVLRHDPRFQVADEQKRAIDEFVEKCQLDPAEHKVTDGSSGADAECFRTEKEMLLALQALITGLDKPTNDAALAVYLDFSHLKQMAFHHGEPGKYWLKPRTHQLIGEAELLTAKQFLYVPLCAIVTFGLANIGNTQLERFSSAFLVSSVYAMAGMTYGIVNDLYATKMSFPYFQLGHQQMQHNIVCSNDREVVSIAWGVLASRPLSMVGALISFVAITAINPPSVLWTSVLSMFIPLLAKAIDLRAQAIAKQHVRQGIARVSNGGYFTAAIKHFLRRGTWQTRTEYLNRIATKAELTGEESRFLNKVPCSVANFSNPEFVSAMKKTGMLNDYQLSALAKHYNTPQHAANYFANTNRADYSYSLVPLTGVIFLCLMAKVDWKLEDHLVSTIMPVVTASVNLIYLYVMLNYALINATFNTYSFTKHSPPAYDYASGVAKSYAFNKIHTPEALTSWSAANNLKGAAQVWLSNSRQAWWNCSRANTQRISTLHKLIMLLSIEETRYTHNGLTDVEKNFLDQSCLGGLYRQWLASAPATASAESKPEVVGAGVGISAI
ncbi:MAG: hypothetical protein P1U40_00470 [Coxiellaceae bacterium]|nr:hypothetical protein [Coxiellaceae bacterium]